jgi:hypothetical protein
MLDNEYDIIAFDADYCGIYRCMLVGQNLASKSCVQLNIWKVTDLRGVNRVRTSTLNSSSILSVILVQ